MPSIKEVLDLRDKMEVGEDEMLGLLKKIVPSTVKEAIHRARDPRYGVSTNYVPLTPAELSASPELLTAWQDKSIPAAQRRVVDAELAAMRQGHPPAIYEVLADAVRATGMERESILDVGCSSGYYSQVLPYLLDHPVDYTGLDYSRPLIEMARRLYPNTRFEMGDAASLPYSVAAFHIVISGCVLLHVPEWQIAIQEAARVSKRWVIFHRTPINPDATQMFQKSAYGVNCMEMSFGERELLDAFTGAGLSLTQEWAIDNDTKTYLCQKAD